MVSGPNATLSPTSLFYRMDLMIRDFQIVGESETTRA